MPIGMVIGALVPSTQQVGTWGLLPVMVLMGISGTFHPVQQLWGWVEGAWAVVGVDLTPIVLRRMVR